MAFVCSHIYYVFTIIIPCIWHWCVHTQTTCSHILRLLASMYVNHSRIDFTDGEYLVAVYTGFRHHGLVSWQFRLREEPADSVVRVGFFGEGTTLRWLEIAGDSWRFINGRCFGCVYRRLC